MLRGLWRDSSGASYIQIFLASSAIAGMALVGLKMAEDQERLVNKTYHNYLAKYLFQEIKGVLSKEDTCSLTMKGKKPNQDSVKAIKDPFKNRRGEEVVSVLFPSGEMGTSDGHYFGGKVVLRRYQLTDQYESANLEKGLTGLKVVFDLMDKKNQASQSSFFIPIVFSLDKEGFIKECQSKQSLALSGDAQGVWNRKNNVLSLNDLALTIGGASTIATQVSINGNIHLEKEEMVFPCTPAKEGLLIHSAKGRLVFCRIGQWVALGSQDLNWKKKERYAVKLSNQGNKIKTTEPHRFCYLMRVGKNTARDGCQLTRKEQGFLSPYEVSVFTSSVATKAECEVYCVD